MDAFTTSLNVRCSRPAFMSRLKEVSEVAAALPVVDVTMFATEYRFGLKDVSSKEPFCRTTKQLCIDLR